MTSKADTVLAHWPTLNTAIMDMTEREVAALLQHEQKHRGRIRVLLRLYNRFSKLRSQREKLELMQNAKC